MEREREKNLEFRREENNAYDLIHCRYWGIRIPKRLT
jgi:hypothetical protein